MVLARDLGYGASRMAVLSPKSTTCTIPTTVHNLPCWPGGVACGLQGRNQVTHHPGRSHSAVCCYRQSTIGYLQYDRRGQNEARTIAAGRGNVTCPYWGLPWHCRRVSRGVERNRHFSGSVCTVPYWTVLTGIPPPLQPANSTVWPG